jgi:hypothetical protein
MPRPLRRRTWGWDRRRVTGFTRDVAQTSPPTGGVAGYIARLDEDQVRYLVDQIKVGIGPTAGSTAMERMFTNWTPNRGGTGLVDVMGAPAFHDLDPRKNPAGLPDGVAVVGNTVVLAEFKHPRDKPNPRQELWLTALANVTHVWSGVVYPQDWEEFCELLYAMYLEGRRAGDAAE